MYIREQKYPQSKTPPPNYNGSLFMEERAKKEETHEEEKEMQVPILQLPPATPVMSEPKTEEKTSEEKPGGLLSSLIPPGIFGTGEFGFEELLIIGLIFLLSQSEGDDEILVMLALLLFIK